MSSDSTYTLTVSFADIIPDDADFDRFIYNFRREVVEAKHFFDEEGRGSGNGGTWQEIERDLTTFTQKHPGILIEIEEHTPDYDHKARYFAADGKVATIMPVLTWPEFTEDMLR